MCYEQAYTLAPQNQLPNPEKSFASISFGPDYKINGANFEKKNLNRKVYEAVKK